MHILFLTDNFPPEGNAPATRTFEHARWWVTKGHKVTVITCAPNFPEGVVYSGYKNSVYQKEVVEGIEVRRVKTYITANEGFVRRSLDYASFMFSSFLAGLFVRNVDVVVATSPQFFCACGGWAISFVTRKPFVFELRDIWPASIKAVGASANSSLIRILELLELFLYRRAKMIVTVTNSFKRELIDRGIDGTKIEVILNGVDLTRYHPMRKDSSLVTRYGLADMFVAGYLGTHGMAHGLDTLLESAEAMINNKNVLFLFAGGGAMAESVRLKAKDRGLHNVLVLGRQDKEVMPAIWSLCDVSIVHLKNEHLFSKVIPSKIFESMAMGLPIVIGVPKGEATEIIESNNVGVRICPEDSVALCAALTLLSSQKDTMKTLQANCREAAKKYNREALASAMLGLLERVITD